MGNGDNNHSNLTQQEISQDNDSISAIEETNKPREFNEAPPIIENNEPKVASYEDFEAYLNKADCDFVVELPVSKLSVLVRQPGAVNYIMNGKISNDVLKLLTGLNIDPITGSFKLNELSADGMMKLMSLARQYFCDVVISPTFKVKPDQAKKELDVSKVPQNDLLWLLNLELENVESKGGKPVPRQKEEVDNYNNKIASFREEPSGNNDGHGGEEVSQVTERTFRDNK